MHDLPSNAGAISTVIHVTIITTGVEPPVLVHVQRDIQDIGVVVERFLNTITCDM